MTEKTLCDQCIRPGACCKEIMLVGSNPIVFEIQNALTKLEVLVALATAEHSDEWMCNIGLPFMPRYQCRDGNWLLECPRLDSDGRCGDYENRPKLCRDFEPGIDALCVMSCPEKPRHPL